MIRRKLDRLLSGGYLHVFLANAFLQLLGFGSVLLVAKLLLPSQFAMIKLAQAYAAVLVILAGFGLIAPIMLYCADPAYDEQAKQMMLQAAIRRTCFVGLILVIALLLLIRLTTEAQAPERPIYSLYALALPGLALTSLIFVYLQARQQFAFLARSQAMIKSVSILMVLLATYLWGIYGFLIATVLTVHVGLVPLIRHALPGGFSGVRAALPEDFFSRAAYGMIGTFISMLGQSSDFILMDFMNIDRTEVGRYALASVFLLAASTLTGSIQSVVTPKFTALRETPTDFGAYLRSWNRRILLISLIVACSGLAVAWTLERWFFSAQYDGFTAYLAILMLKYVIWSAYAIIGAAMLGAGIIKSGVAVAVLTMLLSFGLGLPLGQWFGVPGIAWTQVFVAIAAFVTVICVQRFEFRRLWGQQIAIGS